MQWVLAVRETVIIGQAGKIFSPLTSPIPPLAFTHTSLEWALTRLQASGLVESSTRTEVAQHYTSHILILTGQPDWLMASCPTTHTCPTPGVMHWASLWGRPQHWYMKEECTTPQDTDMKYHVITILCDAICQFVTAYTESGQLMWAPIYSITLQPLFLCVSFYENMTVDSY